MREIAKQANSEVRIFDGQYVVDQEAFAPRRDFHAKVALLENAVSGAKGLVLGSGNFSYNGLKRSVEAGAAFVAAIKTGKECKIEPVSTAFESLWKTACPLDEIIDGYEAQIAALAGLRDGKRASKSKKQPKGFWIEAGYVTKNRGDNQPGNQIFAPSGFRRFFGLDKVKAGSTLIGTIAFKTDTGPTVTKNYRENDNHMEKLTLPMPEQHGFGVYDGKVLVFEAKGKGFHLTAIELSEFELVYGHRVANLKIMSGGRRFGELV